MKAEEIVCPFCATPLELIDTCPHYLGGGDRGNDDDFNQKLSDIGDELSNLIQELDDEEYDRVITNAPDDLIRLFESVYEDGKYFWMYLEGVVVTHSYTDGCGTSADTEDCFHSDREDFIKKLRDETERAVTWLNTHIKAMGID